MLEIKSWYELRDGLSSIKGKEICKLCSKIHMKLENINTVCAMDMKPPASKFVELNSMMEMLLKEFFKISKQNKEDDRTPEKDKELIRDMTRLRIMFDRAMKEVKIVYKAGNMSAKSIPLVLTSYNYFLNNIYNILMEVSNPEEEVQRMANQFDKTIGLEFEIEKEEEKKHA